MKKTYKINWEKVNIDTGEQFFSPQPMTNPHPWITTPQYKLWIEVEGSSWGWAPVISSASIPISTTTWNLDITNSDISFTPSAIRIQAQLDAGSGTGKATWSDMMFDGTNTGWLYTTWLQDADISASRIIRLYDTATTQFWADPVALIPWWIRVNVTDAAFWGFDPVICILTAWR